VNPTVWIYAFDKLSFYLPQGGPELSEIAKETALTHHRLLLLVFSFISSLGSSGSFKN